MTDSRSQILSATGIAWLLATAFTVTTVVGFLPNPLVGKDALFVTNAAHNLVHLATAIGFATVAMLGARASILFMKSFGVVYLLVGVLGFVVLGSAPEGHLFGLVHINQLDNFLHLGLSALIIAAGFYADARERAVARARTRRASSA